MNLNQLTEKYGIQATKELLDMVLIKENITSKEITIYLKKHEIISRNSRAQLRAYPSKEEVYYGYAMNEHGMRERIRLDNPHKAYRLRVVNGRNSDVFYIFFTSMDVDKFKEELANETTETNESTQLS